MDPGQFRAGNILNTVTPNININLPVFPSNSKVFQVRTQAAISAPGALVPLLPPSKVALKAGGRTGASAVQFCAGSTVPPAGNPGCLTPASGSGINGSVRFTRTTNQFGGPAQSNIAGNADVALRVAGTPPGVVTAIFAFATGAGTGGAGGPFGFTNMSVGPHSRSGQRCRYLHRHRSGQHRGHDPCVRPRCGNLQSEYQLRRTVDHGHAHDFGDGQRGSPVDLHVLRHGLVRQRRRRPLARVGIGQRTCPFGPEREPKLGQLRGGTADQPTPSMSSHGLAAVFGLLAVAGGYVLQRRVRS